MAHPREEEFLAQNERMRALDPEMADQFSDLWKGLNSAQEAIQKTERSDNGLLRIGFWVLIFLVFVLLFCSAVYSQPSSSTLSPRAFGSRSWRENGLAPASLPLSGNLLWDVRLASDGALYYWNGSVWTAITGSGGEEIVDTDDQFASEVPIVDLGLYFTSPQVEGALQETGSSLTSLGLDIGVLQTSIDGIASDPRWADARAPLAHVHSTADITSGTFADTRISSSSITQHESSLESVLDLQDLQGAVTDAQVPDSITVDLATLATTATTALTATTATTATTANFATTAGSATTAATATSATTATTADSATTSTTSATASTALTGDSATAFFPSGTIESARLPDLSVLSGSVTDAQVPDTITKSGTASRCARFDATGTLIAASGDCASGDTTGITSPGGLDTQIQFNDGGSFNADSGLTYVKSTDILNVGSAVKISTGGSISASAVSVVQTGTGLYQPSTNVLGLSANGVEVLRLNYLSSAINYVEITPQITGGGSNNGPTIKGTGSDSSVDLNFDAKGISSRFQWKINGVTKMDYTDIGGQFYLRNMSGGYSVTAGKYIGDSMNNLTIANGGNWVELKGNGVVSVRATDTAVITYVKSAEMSQSQTITDNGVLVVKSPATLTPTTSFLRVTCSDTDGCTGTLSETGAIDGQILRIINVGANTLDLSDTSGVSEMAGNITMVQYQSISFIYDLTSARWIETARSAN